MAGIVHIGFIWFRLGSYECKLKLQAPQNMGISQQAEKLLDFQEVVRSMCLVGWLVNSFASYLASQSVICVVNQIFKQAGDPSGRMV